MKLYVLNMLNMNNSIAICLCTYVQYSIWGPVCVSVCVSVFACLCVCFRDFPVVCQVLIRPVEPGDSH